MPTTPQVTCPHCGKTHPYCTTNPHRPFCSERCKMIDLGKWANEDYRVVVAESLMESEGEARNV